MPEDGAKPNVLPNPCDCCDRHHFVRSLSLAKTTMSYLNPRLPMDIERMVFELAVSEQGAKASTPLMLVAKRVREW